MSSRTSSSYTSAFRSACRFFASLSHPLTHLILDNETSEDLSNFFRQSSPPIQFQHVPPANHRANPSERAIRTYKNHFISTLASTHISFPPDRWDLLLPHAELTLNHFRSFSLDPSISAWHGLHRAIHDFSAHPFIPQVNWSSSTTPLRRGSRGHATVKEPFTLVPPTHITGAIASLSPLPPASAPPIP